MHLGLSSAITSRYGPSVVLEISNCRDNAIADPKVDVFWDNGKLLTGYSVAKETADLLIAPRDEMEEQETAQRRSGVFGESLHPDTTFCVLFAEEHETRRYISCL